ncbi:MAG: triose-phosphate isomerase family protein [Candidatus Daviesbacteria bacterium]|nr:triose-phosphate isomerase family protein [Candidatus Daviesbacteria bacterium]
MWIIANWKSNKNISEALEWVGKIGPNLEKKENLKVVVCPNYTDIEDVKKAIMVGNYPMLVGAQDLSSFDNGPYTGEESARILKDLVDLVILGHSERREIFGETDQMIEEKVKRALEHNIIPLVCVQNKQTPVPENVKLIAFEPISAIGTGNPDNPEDASQIAEFFKTKSDPSGAGLEVLYGGSIDGQNAKAFLNQQNISGLLVGTASLDPDEFLKIVEVSYQFT